MEQAFNIQELDQVIAPLTDMEKGLIAGTGAGLIVVGVGILLFC